MVAYIRRVGIENALIFLAFLASKSHVVPLDMMRKIIAGQECHNDSIPRLELSAAVVAATWRDYLVRNAGEDFEEIILMTDATATKYRIGDWEGKYRTYENFRLRRIRSLTAVSEWH